MENICIMYTKAPLYYIDKSGRILTTAVYSIYQTDKPRMLLQRETSPNLHYDL